MHWKYEVHLKGDTVSACLAVSRHSSRSPPTRQFQTRTKDPSSSNNGVDAVPDYLLTMKLPTRTNVLAKTDINRPHLHRRHDEYPGRNYSTKRFSFV